MQPGKFQQLEAIDVSDIGPEKEADRGLNQSTDRPGNTSVLQDPNRVAQLFATTLTFADDYRKKFVAEWLKGYNQYNNVIDDANKGEWQNRVSIPLPKQAVDITTARVMDSLLSNEDWFDILPFTRADDVRVDRAKKQIKWQLWKSEFREPWATSIKDSFICGFGPMKIWWEERQLDITVDEDQPTGKTTLDYEGNPVGVFTNQKKVSKRTDRRIRFAPIIPTDCWLDNTGRNRFVIHKTRRSMGELEALAQPLLDDDGNVIREAVYDASELRKIKPGNIDPEREVQSSLIRRDTPYINKDLGVDVYEFWGDFPDPTTGNTLFKNVVCTFVNKQVCIRLPQANPYRHGMAPFIIFSPGLAPHQIYGYGLLTAPSLVADAINRQYNVILDKCLLRVGAAIAYPTALRDPDQIKQDHAVFKPGTIFLGRDPDKPPIAPMSPFPAADEVDFQVLDRLIAVYRDATGVNEFATGTPQTDNRKTKEEVQSRVAATQQVFNDAAVHIESTALSPLLKMVYYLMAQFETEYDDQNLLKMFDDPQMQQLLGDLKQMTPEERWIQLYLDAEFRAVGISNQITRQDRLNRLMSFLKSVSADPTLSNLIDKRTLLRQYMRLYDLDPQLVLSQADAILQAQEQQTLGAMMQPADQQQTAASEGQNPHNQTAGRASAAQQPMEQQPQPQAQTQ